VITAIRHQRGGPFDISLPLTDRLAPYCHGLAAGPVAHHPARGDVPYPGDCWARLVVKVWHPEATG